MNRWKASASHFGLSLLVIGGIAITAFLLWYPYALYRVASLDRILLVMLGIDLTAGPLLTLILYRPGKRGLKFDLAVVAIAQLAFLAYGLHTLWSSRPVFLVGTPETFTVVFANEIDDQDLARAADPKWRKLSWAGPILVATRMPEAADERRKIIEEFMAGGAGIERSPKYYMRYEQMASELAKAAKPAKAIDIDDHDINRTGKVASDLGWLPVISRRGEAVMLMDKATGRPLRVVAERAER
ncbi:hypothetical protein [Luteimonas salinilitoris]|uniref:Pilus assembly protein n=1 Tax=Luteimonas salinilitoris TaxID=3237697 RepID=A0ABV4HND0_9GAMM